MGTNHVNLGRELSAVTMEIYPEERRISGKLGEK